MPYQRLSRLREPNCRRGIEGKSTAAGRLWTAQPRVVRHASLVPMVLTGRATRAFTS